MQADSKYPTSLGPIFIAPTEANHLHVSSRNNGYGDEKFLTLRGCEYYVSAHFYRWTDGSFQLGQEFTEVEDSNGKHQRPSNAYERGQSLYVSNRAASQSARNKLSEVLTKAVNEWTAANPDKLYDAETNHIKDALESEMCDLKEAETKVTEIKARVKTLKAKLEAHKGGQS